MGTTRSHVRVDDRGEQVVPVGELAAVQEVPLDDVVSPVAQRLGVARVREKLGDRVAETAEISGVDQQAAVLVLNLLAVTTDIACDDRASLPQRFGDSKPEALFEALLDDHIGMALERVNDCGVFLDVVHRHACDCHSETQFVRQRPPRSLNFVERFRPLRVVGDGVDRRSSENQLSLLHVRERVLREAAHHTERVLDAIPATDLQDDLIVAEPRCRAAAQQVALVPQELLCAVARPASDG